MKIYQVVRREVIGSYSDRQKAEEHAELLNCACDCIGNPREYIIEGISDDREDLEYANRIYEG